MIHPEFQKEISHWARQVDFKTGFLSNLLMKNQHDLHLPVNLICLQGTNLIHQDKHQGWCYYYRQVWKITVFATTRITTASCVVLLYRCSPTTSPDCSELNFSQGMSSQKYYKQKQNTQLKFETHTYLYQLFDVTGLLIFSGLINDLMICFFTDLLHDSYFYCVHMEIQKVASWKNTFQNFVSHTFCVRNMSILIFC